MRSLSISASSAGARSTLVPIAPCRYTTGTPSSGPPVAQAIRRPSRRVMVASRVAVAEAIGDEKRLQLQRIHDPAGACCHPVSGALSAREPGEHVFERGAERLGVLE